MKIGAHFRGKSRYTFVVRAPFSDDVALTTLSPDKRTVPMHRDNFGYWHVEVNSINPETRYVYRIGEQLERPDPASFFQPNSVLGPSQVVDHTLFHWEDQHFNQNLCGKRRKKIDITGYLHSIRN